jgi:leucyl-tRNA synthetase
MREKIVADLAAKGVANEKVNYKMRDWSVSRQRYWGAPIPIINCPKDGAVLVSDDQLPIILPELEDFQPSGDGRSALARATEWLKVDCPKCGGPAERETDTLDTYICSSWYMYRYFDPANENAIFDPAIVKKWEPIDFYNGADHATAHLLYARFIGHFFKKQGMVDQPEPFKKFLFNGKVTASDGQMFSKSKGNGVDPLEIIDSGYGADALRVYLMFAAPLDQWIRWDPQGVPGAHRFLARLWTLVQEYLETDNVELPEATAKQLQKLTHQTIKKVTSDLEGVDYNTAIAALMGNLNELYKLKTKDFGRNDVWQFALEAMVALVAPFAPHISEELWQQLGRDGSVHVDSWPQWDDKFLVEDLIKIAVQVNGKVRTTLEMPADATEEDVVKTALADEKVKNHVSGEPKKIIYIKGKLLSLVV